MQHEPDNISKRVMFPSPIALFNSFSSSSFRALVCVCNDTAAESEKINVSERASERVLFIENLSNECGVQSLCVCFKQMKWNG